MYPGWWVQAGVPGPGSTTLYQPGYTTAGRVLTPGLVTARRGTRVSRKDSLGSSRRKESGPGHLGGSSGSIPSRRKEDSPREAPGDKVTKVTKCG